MPNQQSTIEVAANKNSPVKDLGSHFQSISSIDQKFIGTNMGLRN